MWIYNDKTMEMYNTSRMTGLKTNETEILALFEPATLFTTIKTYTTKSLAEQSFRNLVQAMHENETLYTL